MRVGGIEVLSGIVSHWRHFTHPSHIDYGQWSRSREPIPSSPTSSHTKPITFFVWFIIPRFSHPYPPTHWGLNAQARLLFSGQNCPTGTCIFTSTCPEDSKESDKGGLAPFKITNSLPPTLPPPWKTPAVDSGQSPQRSWQICICKCSN